MAHNMYNPGGGLNVFWVEENMEKCRKEKLREEMEEYEGESISDIMEDFANNLLKSSVQIPLCNTNTTINELEAKFQFIKKHSDDPEDLELAKKILGID